MFLKNTLGLDDLTPSEKSTLNTTLRLIFLLPKLAYYTMAALLSSQATSGFLPLVHLSYTLKCSVMISVKPRTNFSFSKSKAGGCKEDQVWTSHTFQELLVPAWTSQLQALIPTSKTTI